MINNLLFDLDGTLFDFEKSETNALKSALKKYNIDLDDIQLNVYRNINSEKWELFEKGLISRDMVLQGRFIDFFKQMKLNISSSEFNEVYLNFLEDYCYLETGAYDILRKLKLKYNLYIVTNGKETMQLKKLFRSNLACFFNDIFISEAIGFSKPSKDFFDYCFKQIGCDASKCMIIGDSISSDILGGKNANIVTCWYNSKNKKNATNIIPDFEINNLRELSDILNSLT